MNSTPRFVLAIALLISLGTVLASATTETVLYSFQGGTDGSNPSAGLVADAAGNLYGTTTTGGVGPCTGGCGTVFRLSPQPGGNWSEAVLYSFQAGSDGAAPVASLIFDAAGNLYGTTISGGAKNEGTVFQLSPQGGTWAETVLYSFEGGSDGAYVTSPVIFDAAGNLYGTTVFGGGRQNAGVVFQLAPPAQPGGTWTETVLHRFGSPGDGLDPMAGLLVDHQGALYGTTFDGLVFKLTPPAPGHSVWKEKILYQFTGGGNNGSQPCNLSLGKGVLYGTTNLGGSPANAGTVFQLRPTQSGLWSEKTLYSFAGGTDGGLACGPLVSDKLGILYGTTAGNGADILSTVFQLVPQPGGGWIETVLHDFVGSQDGKGPHGGVIFGMDGALYGTTGGGGSSGHGTVYQVVP
jgi:uncharacterized repeat protein (TIGR03803 family)